MRFLYLVVIVCVCVFLSVEKFNEKIIIFFNNNNKKKINNICFEGDLDREDLYGYKSIKFFVVVSLALFKKKIVVVDNMRLPYLENKILAKRHTYILWLYEKLCHIL